VKMFQHRNPERATIDFETRSAADIRNGAWMYARHRTTRIMCLAFQLPGDTEVSEWVAAMGRPGKGFMRPGSPRTLQDLFDYVRSGGLVEAHNVMFERCIWHHLMTKATAEDDDGALGMDAPPVHERQWRCSAAKAASYALPRSLGEAGRALGLDVVKDDEGKRVMLKLSKPRKPRKDEPKDAILFYSYDEAPEDFETMFTYCVDDVRSEHALSEFLPDISDFEYKVWLADFRANWRGVTIDVDLVHAAIEMDRMVKRKLNDELEILTDIAKGTQRKDILRWLQNGGASGTDFLDIHDTAAPTLDWLMGTEKEPNPIYEALHPDTQRVIYIARNINRTSVTKYVRILKCMDPDDHKVRELVMFHGAATGRWSGKGIQVQNFPRGNLDELVGCKIGTVKMEQAVNDVKSRSLSYCEMIYGDVLALLSSVLRGALIPAKGKVFYVADYSAIEARVVLWLAEATKALEVFLRGDDIYCDMASGIYGRPITKKDKDERQFGKVTILGLGYGMGFLTFLLTLRSYDLKFSPAVAHAILGKHAAKYTAWVKERMWPTKPDTTGMSATDTVKAVKKYRAAMTQARSDLRRLTEAREKPEEIVHELALCKFVVDSYRARYPEVKELWSLQENAATKAVMAWLEEKADADENIRDIVPKPIKCGKVTWVVEGRFLKCILPSGRALHYCDPTIKWTPTPWGKKRPELRFMGVHKKTKKWSRMGTYGGSIVENIDQATSRDIMAFALVAIDEAFHEGREPYEPVTTIHDELLAEADEDAGDYKEFEAMMIALPPEMEGCPIAAEGDRLIRYQK